MENAVPKFALWRKTIGVVAGLLVPLVLWFAPIGMERQAQRALAITCFMVIFWATELIDYAVTGLIGCYLYWVLGVAPLSKAFGGFAEDSPWFLLGAMLLGAMATKTGLARRIGYAVISRMGASYSQILLGIIISDFLLTFLIPTGVARVVILAAIAIGLITAFDVEPKSNIGRGLFVILTYTATIFDKMLIASPPSILARGIIEKVGHVPVYWSQWFIAYLPCDLITILVCWRVVLWLYPPEKKVLPGGVAFLKAELDRMGPWSAAEKKCALLMGIALAFWMTDFLHHVSPSAVGIGVGLAACLPKLGILDGQDFKSVNFSLVIFLGTALGMSNVLMETKALDAMTAAMFSWIKPLLSSSFHTTIILYWIAFLYHIPLALESTMLSTSLPPLMNFATSAGLNPLAIGMIWTFAAGGKIFVYQQGVLVLGYSYGYFEAKDVLKIGMVLTVVESLIIFFLVPFYWPLVGIK
jgi:anion transporter